MQGGLETRLAQLVNLLKGSAGRTERRRQRRQQRRQQQRHSRSFIEEQEAREQQRNLRYWLSKVALQDTRAPTSYSCKGAAAAA